MGQIRPWCPTGHVSSDNRCHQVDLAQWPSHWTVPGEFDKGAVVRQSWVGVRGLSGPRSRTAATVRLAVSLFFIGLDRYVRWMSDSKDNGSANSSPIIVSIGASAGGIQALQILFEALSDGTGASFVVIVHLDPQAHSDLASILASHTRMTVVQVQAIEEIKPNHVYVIPPDRRLQDNRP